MPTTSDPHVPDLVRQAKAAAAEQGFGLSCSDATGRLLRLLAARCRDGTLLEVGTGCGVGTAWLAAGMGPRARLHTFETDPERAAVAAEVLRPQANVEVRREDWRTADLPGPVQLAFVDARSGKWEDQQRAIELLDVGGTVVLDDFTPLDQLDWDADPVRDWWCGHPALVSAEVLVTPTEAVLLATRTTLRG